MEPDRIIPVEPLKICNSRTKLPVAIYRSVPTSSQNLMRNCRFRNISPGTKQVLVHRPYTVADGPNPKLICPWRGPYTVRSLSSPVIYRVARDGELAETSVLLGPYRLVPYRVLPHSMICS